VFLAHLAVDHHLLMSEYMIQVFGLSAAGDTLVGDAMLRGVSGGEKRRVTAAEMMVGPALVFALDSVSNGAARARRWFLCFGSVWRGSLSSSKHAINSLPLFPALDEQQTTPLPLFKASTPP
jgi:hypothetical protein